MRAALSKRLLLLVALGAVGLAAIGVALAGILETGSDDATRGTVRSSTFVTASRSSSIVALDLATGSTHALVQPAGRYLAVSSPTWSPDGRRIAFAQQACPHCSFRVAVVDSAGTRTRLIGDPRADINEPAWSPQGGTLAVTTAENTERELGLLVLATGRVHPLDAREARAAEEEEIESPNHPAFSPDGRTVAFEAEVPAERTEIQLLDVTSGRLRPVESEADHFAYPVFSPDGRRVAFSRTDPGLAWNLCTARLDGRDQVCVTHGRANDTEPTWSPGGRAIVFASDRENPKLGLRSLYVVNVDGSGLRRLTTGFDDGAPAFSPDGTKVAFVRRRIVQFERR
jgi:Tol biopolymer transport system component